nr:MAG TPA: hypothetical protein [Caudoviricetes sp.]
MASSLFPRLVFRARRGKTSSPPLQTLHDYISSRTP